MGIYHLDDLFNGTSIAVVGASEKSGTIGHAIMQNLLKSGYEGKLFPINPHYSNVFSIPAYRSLKELEGPIDLAVVAIPLTHVPELIKQCVQVGVKGLVVISAGGKEIGDKGKEIEKEIRQEAKKGGIRVMGPNCLGFFCAASKINASFALDSILPGNMAFISQSGAICTAIADLSVQEQMGFSHYISVGSMLDVDFGDLIDYLGNDSNVKSIILYVESLTNFRKFMSAARAVFQGKTHCGAKSREKRGRSAGGRFAHRGNGRCGRRLYRRFQACRHFASRHHWRAVRLRRTTVQTGPGPKDRGSPLSPTPGDRVSWPRTPCHPMVSNRPPLGPDTKRGLDEVLPHYWSRNNPIDILGDASPERYRQALNVSCIVNGIRRHPDYDGSTGPDGCRGPWAREMTGALGKKTAIVAYRLYGWASPWIKLGKFTIKREFPRMRRRSALSRRSCTWSRILAISSCSRKTPPSLLHSLTFDPSEGRAYYSGGTGSFKQPCLQRRSPKRCWRLTVFPSSLPKTQPATRKPFQLADTLGLSPGDENQFKRYHS